MKAPKSIWVEVDLTGCPVGMDIEKNEGDIQYIRADLVNWEVSTAVHNGFENAIKASAAYGGTVFYTSDFDELAKIKEEG